MIPTCQEVARRIGSGEDLGRLRRIGLSLHLLMCRKCRRYKAQIEEIGNAARELFRGPGDGDAVARLRERLLGGRSDPGKM